ncbi:MAG TPA: cob(I)yrinic acid a,c-diamide adenosyltransferase [Bacteroidales bacterium]|nr:cob(I)yrinic acid a,c-diamide adenosyltransferase [Bacteroidales bacterium]
MRVNKIYTKKGDKGKTFLIGGKRVFKDNIRVEAYGSVDELNAFIGLIRSQRIDITSSSDLITIQKHLFYLGTMLATPYNSALKLRNKITNEDVEFLERSIDRMEATLPVIETFIIPGGDVLISFCHIARTICRRVERLVVKLSKTNKIDTLILTYLNRLSDYLFVLARFFAKVNNIQEEQLSF